jgi:hypothetical protein
MKTNLKRRDFLDTCFKAGFTCCALLSGTNLITGQEPQKVDQKPDPKKLNYCGYTCTLECPLYKGTIENNDELKKKAYEVFKFKEKFGVEFDTEKIYCWGCKVADKPLSINVKACTVRVCAKEKGYDGCIQCDGLTSCNKELWQNFPKFKEMVIGMQKKYNEL